MVNSDNPNTPLDEVAYRKLLAEKAKRDRQKDAVQDKFLATDLELRKAKLLRELMFGEQAALFDDPATRKVGFCTRRAGKSTGTILDALATLLEHPRDNLMYIAQTADLCKTVFLDEAYIFIQQYELPFEINQNSNWIVHTRTNAKILTRGADNLKGTANKLRGLKLRKAYIDESGTFGAEMEDVVLSAIGPSLRDHNGTLILIGTAGRKKEGLFYEACHELRKRTRGERKGEPIYKKFQWSLVDNPHLSADAKDLDLIMEEEGLTSDDPRFMREYLMIWASADSERVWSGYVPEENDYDERIFTLPKEHQWQHLLGLDFGWQDASAIAVIAYSPTCKQVYIRETWQKKHAYSDEIAQKIIEFRGKYNARRLIGDVGGQGKIHQMQLARDYKLMVEPAAKQEKTSYIEYMNSAFKRKELLVAKGDDCTKEFLDVAWNDDKTKIGNHEKDNAAMAAMYGWRAAFSSGAGRSNLPTAPGKVVRDSNWALIEKQRILNEKPKEKQAWWDKNGTNAGKSRKASKSRKGTWSKLF